MDFTLTDEQAAIRDVARAFAAEKIAPHALDWDERHHFPTDVIRESAALGMAAIYVPAEQGGSGLSRLDGALIFEALSYGCPAVAAYISIHNMVAGLVSRFGSPDQISGILPRLVGMDWLSSYCLTEPGAGSDAAALTTRACRTGDMYVLDGTKQFISGAGASDLYVVFARTGGDGPKGISAFLVTADTPGLSFGPNERKMGWNAQPTRQVILDGVTVPATALLGREGEGFAIAMSGLDGGRINIAACSLGPAAFALECSLAYLQERKAFGRQLADFQALRFKIADMATELDAARLMVWRAADGLDRGDDTATTASAMAKRFATDVGFRVVNEALQIHGGYGYLREYGLEKLVRDVRVHQILEGTNEIMRLVIARRLLGGV